MYNERFQNWMLFQLVTQVEWVIFSNNSINNNFLLSCCFLARSAWTVNELEWYCLRRTACIIYVQSKLSRVKFTANRSIYFSLLLVNVMRTMGILHDVLCVCVITFVPEITWRVTFGQPLWNMVVFVVVVVVVFFNSSWIVIIINE